MVCVVATISSLPTRVVSLQGMSPEEATALLFASVPGITYREVAARLGEEPAVILRRLKSALQSLSSRSPGVTWLNPGTPA